MQGVHTYILETNLVSRVCSVAAIPRLLYMVHITLSSILNSFVLLQGYFLKYMCCAQYSCFLYFLDFVPSWYTVQVFS
jgi:hypothetical protein